MHLARSRLQHVMKPSARLMPTRVLPRQQYVLSHRHLSSGSQDGKVEPTPATQPPTPTPTPPPPPPSGGNHFKQSRWRAFLQGLGRVTLVTLVTSAGVFYYVARKDRTPGLQLPPDPTKKTVVILGSGWGATSMLKKLDTKDYNVIVISPRNYFLFTPLLPSVASGTLSARSIIQPTRYIARHKERGVTVIEGTAQEVDPVAKTVTFQDTSEIKGAVSRTTVSYDYLVYAVGAEIQTFGIKGVKEYGCFMKELQDAEQLQKRFMDCVESSAFPGQSQEEIDRLLHIVVVGGGPTGIEVAGEFHDFLVEDLKSWYPDLASRVKLSLVEALPSVLPMFSKKLIDYTMSTFKESNIDVLTQTMVKEVKEKSVVLQMPDKTIKEVPCGILVWAAGNTSRPISRDLMSKFPEDQNNKRGITVDNFLTMAGSKGTIFALGDCTATQYAPTAQAASQQGAYLASHFKALAKRDAILSEIETLKTNPGGDKDAATSQIQKLERKLSKASKLQPFHYSHQGSLAYIGSDKAIADLSFWNEKFASGGVATYLFWRSAYLSTLFSLRNRVLVSTDWMKTKVFGRDVSRE